MKNKHVQQEETAWPIDESTGLAIRRHQVHVPLWSLAGFVHGSLKFKSSATVVNSQLVCLRSVGILNPGIEKFSVNYVLLVCTWRHGGHVGGQEQKHFSPLGTKLYFHVNSSRKYSFVLTPNMAALSRGCKPRISGIFSAPLALWDYYIMTISLTCIITHLIN